MSTVVNIRMQDETLKQTSRLQRSFNAPSKSDVIRRAIEISDALTNSIKNGGKILIEKEDGSISRIILPGLVRE